MAKPVLVVDDDPQVVHLATEVLSWAGFDVWRAGNDVEAYQLIRREGHRLALLVTAINLGDGTGFDVARRARARNPKIEVIYWSENELDFAKQALHSSMFMLKPIDPARLADLASALASCSSNKATRA